MSDQSTSVVLVVEDEMLIRDLVESALEEGGFSIASASSGAQALDLLGRIGAQLVGLVTDIDLGKGPNGWEVARQARRRFPSLAVAYMSGGSAHGWASEGVPDSTMLSKPFAPAQLVVALSQQINVSDTHS